MSDSTLQGLRSAARKVAREYGVDEMRAFEDVGLILTELKHCGYSQAPRNTLAFAHTGGA